MKSELLLFPQGSKLLTICSIRLCKCLDKSFLSYSENGHQGIGVTVAVRYRFRIVG